MTSGASDEFFAALARPFTGEEVFDLMEDTVFFVKDRAGRYVAVNETLTQRCGHTRKSALIGRTADELFPEPLGRAFSEQDAAVVRDGRAITGRLELHLHAAGEQGWCLTSKTPLRDRAGAVVGLCGVSRDLRARADGDSDLDRVATVLARIRDELDTDLTVPELAGSAGLSGYQLDQRIRALFGMSAGQFLIRERIDAACHRLQTGDEAISTIALDCGYADQAAFTRQFRRTVGMTPGAYRAHARKR